MVCGFLCSEQDEGLEALSSVLSRQKQMALDIGNEVDGQNGEAVCCQYTCIRNQ